ncbi:MAG: carbon-nitrogen hydrolase family protein [Alphaproteobacteria bacterium]|nr:carbon-nitrogen hydrolase family protein [Alphaproteobacteria bacterium]
MTPTNRTTERLRTGLIQMCSGRNPEKNIDDACQLIGQAAGLGAQYVLTPEVTNVMDQDRQTLFNVTQPEQGNQALAQLRQAAKTHAIWLHIGSLAIRNSDDKLSNRSYLISPQGDIAARYDKIHMFDVELANGETYAESDNYNPGNEAVIAQTPWGGLGMTICYDLRFPYLFRALAQGGAKMISVPAAFTQPTGEAHWHVLLRARAIETQCFIFAAAQGGLHEHGRKTYGHSLIVSPWGRILAEGGVDPGVITADIDLAEVDQVRSRVPSTRANAEFSLSAPLTAANSRTGG